MNFNFKIKGFEVQVKEEATVKIDEIEVGYKDVKLSEIPAIIKEVRKSFIEIKNAMDADGAVHETHLHAIVPSPFSYPLHVDDDLKSDEEDDAEPKEEYTQEAHDGIDTDGDLNELRQARGKAKSPKTAKLVK